MGATIHATISAPEYTHDVETINSAFVKLASRPYVRSQDIHYRVDRPLQSHLPARTNFVSMLLWPFGRNIQLSIVYTIKSLQPPQLFGVRDHTPKIRFT